MFVLYIMSRDVVVLGRRNREKYTYSIFLKAEVDLTFIFKLLNPSRNIVSGSSIFKEKEWSCIS